MTRYPDEGRSIGIPESFVDDLDRAFCDLLSLVPFQFNSELVNILANVEHVHLDLLRQDNAQMCRLYRLLWPSIKKKPGTGKLAGSGGGLEAE